VAVETEIVAVLLAQVVQVAVEQAEKMAEVNLL
jgi:hypothetical protein